MLMENLDLNIWDMWAYETDGQITGGWVINTYLLPAEGVAYGSGKQTEHTLHLRTKEARALNLGVETDDDFWIDAQSLLADERTSRRIRIWIERVIDQVSIDGRIPCVTCDVRPADQKYPKDGARGEIAGYECESCAEYASERYHEAMVG